MGGEDSNGGGHEFVCSGRDANNKFYINWGWEGSGNGYYALSSLKPTGTSYNFSSNLDALIGLEPNKPSTLIETVATPEVKTGKVIENGQLYIIRNNEKYSVFGQKIQ